MYVRTVCTVHTYVVCTVLTLNAFVTHLRNNKFDCCSFVQRKLQYSKFFHCSKHKTSAIDCMEIYAYDPFMLFVEVHVLPSSIVLREYTVCMYVCMYKR